MESEEAVLALSALAHGPRLAVFQLLVRAGPSGVAAGEIARRIGSPPNTLSANLNLLNRAGLVHPHRVGRSIVYTADFGRMTALLDFLVEDCCNGAPEICAPLARTARACRP